MKRIILLVALLLCLSPPAFAATAWNTSTLQRFNAANLPRSPSTGMMFYVLDGSTSTDCTTGGGTTKVVCVFNGSTYVGIGGGDIATATIYDALGDLPVGTGPNTAAVLTAATDYSILSTLSGEATGLKWIVPVADGLWGCNSSGTLCQYYTTHRHDNSAAQFNDSSDTTKQVLIDPSNQGSGQTGTIRAPVSGTAVLSAGTQVAHDGTKIDAGALNFISTGLISGGIPIFYQGTTYTIGTNGSSESYGALLQLSAASNLIGMPAVPRVGMSGCVFSTMGASGQTIKLQPDATSWFVLSGTAKAANTRIVSSGATGDYACWVVTAPSTYRVFGLSGTWQ